MQVVYCRIMVASAFHTDVFCKQAKIGVISLVLSGKVSEFVLFG